MEHKDEIEAKSLTAGDDLPDKIQSPTDETTPTQAAHPFKKWMDTFRTRKYVPPGIPERYVEGWPDDLQTGNAHLSAQDPQWERNSGHSSHLALKTATISNTSQSEERSRGTTHSTTTQSVLSDLRASGDSSRPSSSNYVDEAAEIRATKRRCVLQELLATEDDYVLGLKALTGVLSLFSARTQIQHNIQHIGEIHERFQGRLHRTSPLSSRQAAAEASDFVSRGLSKRLGGIDIRGLKALPSRSLRTRSFKAAVDQHRKSLVADPVEVLEVAREIEKLPIQRLCKYPLLLQDLLRHTPVSDCPTSHDAIRQILDNIRILVTQINSATGNPINKDRIHKTLLLQERIQFADSVCLSLSMLRTSDNLGNEQQYMLQDVYRDLGPMVLCGVLHVTYQTSEQITGDFMVCVLFNSYFLIAKIIDDSHRLEAVACIYMDDLKMDTIQNGRGIYCYGCPFSWKILFQDQEENFEFVLSASSATEEKQWKTDTLKYSAALSELGKPGAQEPRKYSLLTTLLVPLDRTQYTVASLARRSMDAVAISRKSTSQHVVIRKTRCPQTHDESTESSSEIDRPTSPIARTPWVVTAKRMDRVRLERLISEVYTRDVLPWPGMILGRGDLLFGRGSIMRHLSLHKGFAKRPISISTSHSGPLVAESLAIDNYNGEEKQLITSQDGCGDQQSPVTDCESPKTPTSIMGRSKTVRFGATSKKSLSLPREKRPTQDDNLDSSPRKKWSSPMTLLSALSPKNLIRSRVESGTEE
ncbi:uncharacterized protein N7503_006695 [Penicillium pulvis]|uniref:uncharacterized protein n=1 Tax=Penicillium pulvis TaxID=1562058 RepID=UPI0025471108|nr:uncharacterized protein N7503_006695 [Penicillium pulvis]KAJ5797399.1 hypothetical protein N7503_006695 [Penicillium pulvis]